MIIWTALASAFAALLGYSRIPYASARAGISSRPSPRSSDGRVSPPLVAPARRAGDARLPGRADDRDRRLLTSRILIQFVGQIATVFYLRSR